MVSPTALPLRAFGILIMLVLVSGCASKTRPDVRRDVAIEEDKRNAARAGARRDLESGKYDEAIRKLKSILREDPYDGNARNSLGVALLKKGSLYEAALEFEYAVKLLPTAPEPLNNIGLTLESARRFDEAIARFDEANALQPDNLEYYANSTRCRIRRGDEGVEIENRLRRIADEDVRPEWKSWAAALLVAHAPASRPAGF
jgi:Tfp pilus assembly protein PilF